MKDKDYSDKVCHADSSGAVISGLIKVYSYLRCLKLILAFLIGGQGRGEFLYLLIKLYSALNNFYARVVYFGMAYSELSHCFKAI